MPKIYYKPPSKGLRGVEFWWFFAALEQAQRRSGTESEYIELARKGRPGLVLAVSDRQDKSWPTFEVTP